MLTSFPDRRNPMAPSLSGFRRTRIVCTLGPACTDPGVLGRMVESGMDVARLNFSHGTHASHAAILATLRTAASRAGRFVGVLQDLCGPKIRVGEMAGDGVELVAGQEARFDCGAVRAGGLPVEYGELYRDVHPGDRILFDDGRMEARVSRVEDSSVYVLVLRGGRLKTRKGMNLPGVRVSAPAVTPKDLDDLEWGIANGVDFVAVSFVHAAEDLDPVRARLASVEDPPQLLAKIETPEAVHEIDRILDVVDGIMVARGDLGVEMDFAAVPVIQKQLIRRANERDLPVITATQMLESMTSSALPTRAEASDVANAILDGSDAVMLSGETASGQYPVESLQAMDRVAREAERWLLSLPPDPRSSREVAPTSLHDALALGAERIARNLDVRAIVVATLGGDSARFVSSSRPRVPVLVISPREETLRRTALHWGLSAARCPGFATPADALAHAEVAVTEAGLARDGDWFVLVSGRGPSAEGSGRIHVRRIGAMSD
jgi:pyruvate kinase